MTALAAPPIMRTAPVSRGAVAPLPGETQAAFAERYHATMAKSIPQTDRRNVEMMRCWKQSGAGADLDRCAAARFRDSEFVHVPNVPVFAEHTTKDGQGKIAIYDRRALEVIVERCNTRILDTGDFPPLTEGHTPTSDEIAAGREMPEVLGYAGPFRLGQIGNVTPRWAIFADEWHHRDCVARLSKMQRRSPEVWLEERMEDRFLDPIAALGAETPRLDLGTARYGRRPDGRVVEKYTASLPGAMTTFVPGADAAGKPDRKDRYEGQGMITPEDTQGIVDAILSSELMSWLAEAAPRLDALLAQAPAAGAPAGPEAAVPGTPPTPAAAAPPTAAEKPPEAKPDTKAPYEPDDEDREQFRKYMAGDCSEEEMTQYAAGKRKNYAAGGAAGNRAMWAQVDDAKGHLKDKKTGESFYDNDKMEGDWHKRYGADAGTVAGPETKPGEGTVQTNAEKSPAAANVADPALMKLSRRSSPVEKARYEKLEAEVAELRQRAETAERDREKTERYSRVSEARQTRGFNEADLEPFLDPAKYGREAFDAALNIAVNSSEEILLADRHTLPIPRHVPEGDQEKLSRKRSDRARAIADQYARRGEHIRYDDAIDLAIKEEGAAARTA